MRRSPRGEFAHERASFRILANGNFTDFINTARRIEQRHTRVHINRNRRNRIIDFAKVHTDNTRNVIVDDNGFRAHLRCDFHLFLERGIPTFYKRNTSERIAVAALEQIGFGIVFRTPRILYDDVFKFLFFRVAEHLFKEIVRLAVFVARFFIERVHGFFRRAARHVRRFLTADTRYGERRRERRGRADRAGIGVGDKVRTEHTAIARAVIVTCRANKANTRRLNGLVYVVERRTFFVAVVRGRKPARRTQRHIDNVYAERNAIVQSRDNVFRHRAANVFAIQIVREHFTNHELGIGRNATEFVGYVCAVLIRIPRVYVRIPADNTCNVRAVVGIGRIYVRILIRVIVRKRHFCAHVNIVDVELPRRFFRFQVLFQKLGYVRFAPSGVIGQTLKRFVRIVKPRIQNSHHRAFAKVARAAVRVVFRYVRIHRRIVNTRIVDARYVGNIRRVRRFHRRRYGVGTRNFHALYTRHFLNGRNVLGVNLNRYAVHNRVVTVNELIGNTRFFEFLQERVLLVANRVLRLFSVPRI